MKKNITNLLFIFLLLFAKESLAQIQELKFDLIKGSNGVSLGKVNCIIQDKYGFIWLSDQTNRCIVRYDGNTMMRLQNDPKDTNSLGGYYPECLYGDSSGNIWIGFWGTGLDKFDPVTRKFTHYRHQQNNPESLSNDTVNCIRIDHLGNIWIGTNHGLDLLDQKTGKFKHYKNKPNDASSLSYDLVRSLYEDHEGELWVGAGIFYTNDNEGGLNRFNRNNGTFTRYLNDPKNPHSLINNKVRSIFEDSRGNFWIGTNGDGLQTMDRKTGVFTRYPYDHKNPEQLSRPSLANPIDHITFITEDADKKIWIGTMFSGINRYDPDTKKIIHYGNDADKTGSFKDNSGWWAYASRDGHVWIATQSSNLFKIDVFNYKLTHYGKSELDATYCFYDESPSVLWMGTENGFIRKDIKTSTVKKFIHDPSDPKSLINNKVIKIIKSKQGGLWLATWGGLEKFDPQTEKFTHYVPNPSDSTSIADIYVNALLEDRESNIWIGLGGSGLDRLDTKTGKFTHYKFNPSDSSGISGDIVSTLMEDETFDLWIGLGRNSGLNRLNKQTGKFKHYLPQANISDIHKDSSGIIWLATSGGIFKYNRESDDFVSIADNNPELQLSGTRSITPDNDNNFWIGSDNGIYKFNKKRNSLVLYNINSRSYDEASLFNGAAFKRQDGEIYFGQGFGYYAFYPDKLKPVPGNSTIYFSNFWLANEIVKIDKDGPLKEPLFNTKEIKLSYKQDVFSISFSSIDFRSTVNQKLYYRLEDFDNDWRQANAEERVQYYRVPPGKYTFHIKTTTVNGDTLENSIAVIISPPWYTSWWAYLIYCLLFIVFIFFIDRFQKARVIKAEREKTRTRELAQAKEIEKAYTELKATQSQLIQSEKMASLGQLTAGIAHEIQNPLNFVNNFSEVNKELLAEMNAEIVKGNYDEVKAIAKDVTENEEKINHHGKRADAIVKGMLQHSRSSSGTKEPTNINALADEYLRLSYHGLRAKDKSFNATLNTDFDETIGNINIIPQDIGRVVLNLINNAFYVVDEKSKKGIAGFEPTVTVSTKKVADKVLITVKDNGNGIQQKVLDKIFQPFFTTKPTGQGTGLGLSLSYDIIKAHGGELKVETKENEGATFIIQLPTKASS